MPKPQNQITELKELRETILTIIEYLKLNIVEPITKKDATLEENERLESQLNILVGKKSNISATITQLSTLLIKIIPLELKLKKDFALDESSDSSRVTKEDIEIINRYLNKIKNSDNTENVDIRKEPDLFDYAE